MPQTDVGYPVSPEYLQESVYNLRGLSALVRLSVCPPCSSNVRRFRLQRPCAFGTCESGLQQFYLRQGSLCGAIDTHFSLGFLSNLGVGRGGSSIFDGVRRVRYSNLLRF